MSWQTNESWLWYLWDQLISSFLYWGRLWRELQLRTISLLMSLKNLLSSTRSKRLVTCSFRLSLIPLMHNMSPLKRFNGQSISQDNWKKESALPEVKVNSFSISPDNLIDLGAASKILEVRTIRLRFSLIWVGIDHIVLSIGCQNRLKIRYWA